MAAINTTFVKVFTRPVEESIEVGEESWQKVDVTVKYSEKSFGLTFTAEWIAQALVANEPVTWPGNASNILDGIVLDRSTSQKGDYAMQSTDKRVIALAKLIMKEFIEKKELTIEQMRALKSPSMEESVIIEEKKKTKDGPKCCCQVFCVNLTFPEIAGGLALVGYVLVSQLFPTPPPKEEKSFSVKNSFQKRGSSRINYSKSVIQREKTESLVYKSF
ncbi:MAG: hypothetical protein K1060chlam2_00669 [Chlamydiae bacterium]|nr:hypothetical protein [Chlamydiota bacterium]